MRKNVFPVGTFKNKTVMKHTEDSIRAVKKSLAEMWVLVQGQVEKAVQALLTGNAELAHEVIGREKLVDSYELAIDRECENFFALLNPVAVDLRMMLSVIKINNNLERIGDFAEGIASFAARHPGVGVDQQLQEKLRLREMTETALEMLNLCKTALAREDGKTAGKVFLRDDTLDRIHGDSVDILAGYIREHPNAARECLLLHSAIRRIERIGDRCSNIAEDIVFYLEARVLKHSALSEGAVGGTENGKE